MESDTPLITDTYRVELIETILVLVYNKRNIKNIYLRISLRATIPALKQWAFLSPPCEGADILAALLTLLVVTHGRRLIVDAFVVCNFFLAVCLVLAMFLQYQI